MAIKDLVVRLRAEGAQQMRGAFRNAEAGMISMSARAVAVGQIIAGAFWGAVRAVRGAFRYVWNQYKEQQKADNVLIASIRAAGQSVDELMPKYRTLAAEIQKVTAVGDEQTQMMIATATNMGVSADKMEETIKGAIGLSRTLRDANGETMDFASAVKYLILAQGGEMTMLQRYMPQLRTLATDEEKLALLNRKMVEGWTLAQDETGQLSIKLQQLRNDFGDLVQDFIAGATGETDFTKALEKIRTAIKEIDAKELGESFSGLLKDAQAFIENIDFSDIADDISSMADNIERFMYALGGTARDLSVAGSKAASFVKAPKLSPELYKQMGTVDKIVYMTGLFPPRYAELQAKYEGRGGALFGGSVYGNDGKPVEVVIVDGGPASK